MAYQSEIEKLEQRFREKPEQWFAALADAYRKAGDLDLALDLVRTWAQKRPTYTSGLIVLGRCLVDKKDDDEAARVFEGVLDIDAENIIAIRSLSDIAFRQQDSARARQWLERLLEVDPMNEEARTALDELALEPAAPPERGPVAHAEPGAAALERKEQPKRPPAEDEPGIAIEHASDAMADASTVQMESLELEVSRDAELPSVSDDAPAAAEPAAPPAPEEARRPLRSEEPGTAPRAPAGAAGDEGLDLMPFDEELTWDAGERMSKQITEEVLEQAAELHEESLDAPVHALPGLETTEVPELSPPEPPAAEQPPDAAAAGEEREPDRLPRAQDVGDAAQEVDVDLPLIMPEEMEGVDEAGAGPELEPVVTETMAQLYARQGLYAEARDIYRQLAARKPDDAALARRAAEMEAAVRSAGERQAGSRAARYAVDDAAGESARALMRNVVAARPSGADTATGRSTPAPPRAPGEGREGEGGLLGDLFGDDELGVPGGEPTREADEEIVLSSVFGDEQAEPGSPPPAEDESPEPPATAGRGERDEASGDFSFDEFFGTEPGPSGGEGGDAGEEVGEEDDDFQDWLKGLRT